MFFKRVLEYGFLWVFGGFVYYLIEVFFRGFSHWSMFVLGGLCMMFFAFQGMESKWSDPLIIQVIRCSVFVTAGEFITGILVNKFLHLNVWDYSKMPFQLFGQICLPFALLFSCLCMAGIPLAGYLLYWIFEEEKPIYRLR